MEIVIAMEKQAGSISLVTALPMESRKHPCCPMFAVLRRCSNVSTAAVGWEGHRRGCCQQGKALLNSPVKSKGVDL